MARVEFAPEVIDDLDRFADHLATFGIVEGPQRIRELIEAFEILEHSPLLGRRTDDGKRELVVGRGARGYVALYRYVSEIDVVFVLAIRNQREDGYPSAK